MKPKVWQSVVKFYQIKNHDENVEDLSIVFDSEVKYL